MGIVLHTSLFLIFFFNLFKIGLRYVANSFCFVVTLIVEIFSWGFAEILF